MLLEESRYLFGISGEPSALQENKVAVSHYLVNHLDFGARLHSRFLPILDRGQRQV
jgi:hypothetical protein